MSRPAAALASLAALVALLSPVALRPAYACSCAIDSLENQVERTQTILLGTVTDAPIIPPLDPDNPDDLEHVTYVVVRIDRYLKGSGPSELKLATSNSYSFTDEGQLLTGMSTCSMLGPDSKAHSYVLFFPDGLAAGSEPGICSGSRSLDEGYLQEVLGAIDSPGVLPPTGGPPSGGDGGGAWLPIAVGSALATAAAFAASAFILRRRMMGRG